MISDLKGALSIADVIELLFTMNQKIGHDLNCLFTVPLTKNGGITSKKGGLTKIRANKSLIDLTTASLMVPENLSSNFDTSSTGSHFSSVFSAPLNSVTEQNCG